jgi:hypothetical protein
MAWRARVIEFVGGDHANRIPLDIRRSVGIRPLSSVTPGSLTYRVHISTVWN